MPSTTTPDHDIDAGGARLGILIGIACATGAVLGAVLLQIWLQASPFKLDWVGPWALVALAAAVALLVICGWQLLAWRAHPEIPRESAGMLGTRASWWVHVLSYPVALLGELACVIVLAWSAVGNAGFWLALGVGLLIVLAQVIGATQFLRDRGLPGTIGRHVRAFVNRSNERADAAAEAAEEAGR